MRNFSKNLPPTTSGWLERQWRSLLTGPPEAEQLNYAPARKVQGLFAQPQQKNISTEW